MAVLLLPVVNSTSGDNPEANPASFRCHSAASSRGTGYLSHIPQIVEIYYNSLVSNEFVSVAINGDNSYDLTNWTLTDGEGKLSFPPGTTLLPSQPIVVAQNSTLYYRDTLKTADFSYDGGNSTSMLRLGGLFRLSNEGDEVLLVDDGGGVIDAFVYGTSRYFGFGWNGNPAKILAKGLVAKRAVSSGAYLDSNTSMDWDSILTHVIGQSSYPVKTLEFDGVGQAILSPDSSLDSILNVIDSAEYSIYLNVYEFTDSSLKTGLIEAVERGIDLRVLVEGNPVAGMQESELKLLTEIRRLGASVRVLLDNSSLGVKARYRYDHAKYLVIDNRTVVVMSENWGTSGFPVTGRSGNRGWSVRLENPGLAAFLSQVFLDDWNPKRVDSVDIQDAQIAPVADERNESTVTYDNLMIQEPIQGHFHVTPVIGPDNTLGDDTLLSLVRSAGTSIYVEQFYVSTSWDAHPNLYLEEILNAARRGVDVKVLLDSSWYNTDENETVDNDDTVAYLKKVAESENLPLKAKLGNSESHSFVKFHNKGVVVDGEKVLVSSINWNLNSVTQNREIGLIIENKDLAGFFAGVFEYDWKDDVIPPIADAGENMTVVVGAEVYFSAVGSRDDSAITSYLWDMGADGIVDLTGAIVEWRFDKPGEYVVVLRVWDSWGNAGSDRIVVTVLPKPVSPTVENLSPYSPIAVTSLLAIIALAAAIVVWRRKE